MANMPAAPDYFASVGSEVVVRETPKFELDLYIQNYAGRNKFDRLLLIGRSSVPLHVDALKAAVAEAKRGKDTGRYREAFECLQLAAPGDPDLHFDRRWYDEVETANKAARSRLEAELKGYKNNLVKESIRMGHEDLGKHLEATGDLNAASDAFSKMRPEVSTPKHIIEVGKHLANVSLQRRDWGSVISNVSKISGMQNSEEEKSIAPYITVMSGVALLGQERYAEAAHEFLMTDYAVGSAQYGHLITPNDVATYGGLLALASMDRKELQSKVLDNANFRQFLELEPHIRRAITQFVGGRYSACLSTLDSYKPDYLLDLYLQAHVSRLYAQIRSKCIVQYLAPFSCVTLNSMSTAFGVSDEEMEAELVDMIKSGALQARINAIDKLVTTVSGNPRRKMEAAALEAAKSYEKEAINRLRLMSIIAAELEIKGKKPAGNAALVGSDEQYEDYPVSMV